MDQNICETTLVTAFFDIGRKNWRGYERSNEKYLDFFKFWARIQNRLIVYTDAQTAKQILEIRSAFDLKDKTIIQIVNDVFQLDRHIYEGYSNVLSNPTTINFRVSKNNPESYNANYNYLVYLKPYFVSNAIEQGLVTNNVAWIDFGFNHGREYYQNSEEFAFTWQDTIWDKITLFAIKPLDNMPVFEIIRRLEDYFTGGIICAPQEIWAEFAQLYRNAAQSIIDCGFSDDDQLLTVMAYRKRPELFRIVQISNFFESLEVAVNRKFTIADDPVAKTKKYYKELLKKHKYMCALKAYITYKKLKAHKLKHG